MTTVRLALTGGVVQGNHGTYQAGSDGTAAVDTRDAIGLIAGGSASYLDTSSGFYTSPIAPAAATVGRIIASGALSNGTITISNQPDVMRQVNMVWGTGTVAISAGSIAISYVANDGQTYTESVALALAASATGTHPLSRGVVHISAPIVTGLTGGVTPFRRFDTTAFLAVPVDPAAQDYATAAESVDGAFETGGWSDSVTSIGCVSPNTAPNATHLFSLFYNFVAPVI
jgi:hypothetical protein